MFTDPTGMVPEDIYRFDRKSGELVLEIKTDDNFDQIRSFKYDKKTDSYKLKTNKDGSSNILVDNIVKGILKDGINFKQDNNVIEVNGTGQPTESQFQDFIVDYTKLAGVEVSGYGLGSKTTSKDVSAYLVEAHKGNTSTTSISARHMQDIRVFHILYTVKNIINNIMKKVFLKQQIGRLTYWILLISIFGCSSLREEQKSSDIYSSLMIDFYKTYKSDINQYQYFNIRSYDIENTNISIYRISPEYNKVVLGPEGDAYYPRDYEEFKNKVFFIEGDITNKPSEKVFVFLKNRNLMDSAMYKLSKEILRYEDLKDNEGKILSNNKTKITTYVICK